jgi:glutathione S-transferase
MYTIYCRKSAGSMAVEALLEACGAGYEVHDLQRNPDNSFPDYFLRINPKAEVPTLKLPDDTIMTESAAMMIYLADLHPKAGLAPAVTAKERPQYLRWMSYLATSVYNSDLRLYYPQRFTSQPEECAGIRMRAAETMSREFEIYSDALGRGPFMFGAAMSALDIYAAMLASWAPDVPALFAKHPNIKTMYEAVTAHRAIAKVWVRNGV